MAASKVLSLADLTALAFESRRPGYALALLHENGALRLSVLRLQQGSGVPANKHSDTDDLFFGIEGELEIVWDDGCSLLRPGGFCRVPAGMRHGVRNRSGGRDAYCLLLHSGRGPFDFIEAE